MKSHHYDFSLADLLRWGASLVAPMVVFGVLMRLGALAHLLPAPWPALDVDRTILTRQAAASQATNSADLLVIGDSSCLMDVSGARLNELLRPQHQALNLGTFMSVGLEGYAALLAHDVDANPGRVRTVVVLMHPETLRTAPAGPAYFRFLSEFYSGIDPVAAVSVTDQLRGVFGLSVFQDRLLSRTPMPLPKEYGRSYGFNLDLDRFMEQHAGSAVDPHQYVAEPGQGNADYRLSRELEPGWRALRAAIPAGAGLVVCLAPIPQSFAPPGYAARWQALLEECGRQIQADVVLTNLPPVLPDLDFASTTHLNASGARGYTERLSVALKAAF